MKKLIIVIILIIAVAGLISGLLPDKEYDFSNVVLASEQQINKIKSGLGKNIIVGNNIFAIKSNNHKNAYYVIADLYGPGMNGSNGIWFITGSIDNTGLIFAVNGIAKNFSSYPDGSKSNAAVSVVDEEAKILEKYLNKNAQK